MVQVAGSFHDIHRRKLAEDRIEHLNRLLRAVRAIIQLIAASATCDAPAQACDLLIQHRSYAGAILVLSGSDSQPLFWTHAGSREAFGPSVRELADGQLPACLQTAAAVAGPSLCRQHGSAEEGSATPAAKPASILCQPLADRGVSYGFLAVAVQSEVGFDDAEQALLAELSDDLAYALGVLAEREARAQAERDRDALERQLAQAARMEAVGQLAGGVAHDFNNILQAIIGYAELLAGSPTLAPADRPSIEEILKGGERAATLTRQLLAFSRRQVMQPVVLDLNDLVADLLKMVRRLIGEHLELVWRPATEPALIQADAGMIEQVIVNLCVNARDAMPDGGRLTITAELVNVADDYLVVHPWAQPGRYVLLDVSDTGCGMDRETLDRIFEPFFTTKSDGRGTGLGLATVYGIVKQHDGMIDASSEPGAGTTFQVYLPLTAGEVAVTTSAGSAEAVGGTETVLLAEDDALVRRLATTILERAGYCVLAAEDGRRAVALFEEHADTVAAAILECRHAPPQRPQVYEQLCRRRPDLPWLVFQRLQRSRDPHRLRPPRGRDSAAEALWTRGPAAPRARGARPWPHRRELSPARQPAAERAPENTERTA